MAADVARPFIREPLPEAKTFADGWSSRLLRRVLAKTLQTDEVAAWSWRKRAMLTGTAGKVHAPP